MIGKENFNKKQILMVFTNRKEKLCVANENIVVKDEDGKVRFKSSCYRLFAVFIIGDMSITTPLIRMSKKFMFNIFLMTSSFKLYQVIGSGMEGNTMLRKKQYEYSSLELGKKIILNKIDNQKETIKKIRTQSPERKNAINDINSIYNKLYKAVNPTLSEIMGYEGSAAKIYFSFFFSEHNWKRRAPRIKEDYINSILDIGYTILFNYIDAILRVYGFDNYIGVLHRTFYQRKSLVCDIVEPIRPIIDYEIRKAINLGIFCEDDFINSNGKYLLKYEESPRYTSRFLQVIYEYRDHIFLYIQSYYRCFMKGDFDRFPKFEVIK